MRETPTEVGGSERCCLSTLKKRFTVRSRCKDTSTLADRRRRRTLHYPSNRRPASPRSHQFGPPGRERLKNRLFRTHTAGNLARRPQAAKHLYHLFEALKGKQKSLLWTSACGESFKAVKEALASAVMLRHPRPDAPLAITSDASDHAIGAVIEQRGPDGWEPLSFFSAKLLPNQQLWPPFDWELLAAFCSIRHLRHIEG